MHSFKDIIDIVSREQFDDSCVWGVGDLFS